MQYAVVHSNDPWLLARLATDLQMSGSDKLTYNVNDPFIMGVEWLTNYGNDFGFYIHECVASVDAIRLELTDENYISVLTKILE